MRGVSSKRRTRWRTQTQRARVFVGEDVVNLNDVKRIESIAFPNENIDDLVLVSALNGEDECRLLALRKKDGQWTASKLGGGFDIDPTQDAATGNPFARRPN